MTLGTDSLHRFDLSGSCAVKLAVQRVDRRPGKVIVQRAEHDLGGTEWSNDVKN